MAHERNREWNAEEGKFNFATHNQQPTTYHRTRDDYYSYRRPLGMFHYLNT